MPFEIERKFLLADGDRPRLAEGARYCQGYLSRGEVTVRVRRAADQAFLTVKGRPRGIVRPEFEYGIPVEDAEALLSLCKRPLIEKTRYCVPFGGHVWFVDVFGGGNSGLVLAEIELDHADESFERPPWLGREVTHDRRYSNSALGIRENAAGAA